MNKLQKLIIYVTSNFALCIFYSYLSIYKFNNN